MGKGSVYRRSTDGRWVGAITLEDGRRRNVYGKTQAEARSHLPELQREIEAGRAIAPGRALTLDQYLRHWIDTTLRARLASGRLRSSTFDSYRSGVQKHIIPYLGREPLATLRPPAVRRWLTVKLEEKSPTGRVLSSRSVQYLHSILRKALRDAMTDGFTTRNAASLVEPPIARSPEIEPLTLEEARKLIEKAAGARLRVLWLVLLALGLRLGEALALRWEDLDRGTVTIRRSVQRLRGDPDPVTGRCRTRLVESMPKTAASRATIAIPEMLVAVLHDHKAEQNQERMRARAWADPGLVFSTPIGTFLEQRNVNRDWTALCAAAGVRRVRVHDLRHVAASFMLAEGVDMKLIQATLRHSRLSTTADAYTHVIIKVQRQAADRMDGVLRQITDRPDSGHGGQEGSAI